MVSIILVLLFLLKGFAFGSLTLQAYLEPNCPWSEQLKVEILDHADFQHPCDIIYESGFPRFILRDQEGNLVCEKKYFPTSPKEWSKILSTLQNQYEQLAESSLSLEKKYLLAKEAGFTIRADLLQEGVKGNHLFFLLEEYEELIRKGIRDKQLLEKIVKKEPHNLKRILLDVDYYVSKGKIQTALELLLGYIDQYGKITKNHLWQLKLIASELFFRLHDVSTAIAYAKQALDYSPSFAEAEITRTLDYFSKYLQ